MCFTGFCTSNINLHDINANDNNGIPTHGRSHLQSTGSIDGYVPCYLVRHRKWPCQETSCVGTKAHAMYVAMSTRCHCYDVLYVLHRAFLIKVKTLNAS
jgi:hypothetical protein